ncbi:hypothetical protein BpHYR1_003987 [Brachionus plicatilis]|uniref:Uncharacterized protein n=1 Tax=Brachionus plicatilis TaxID=10195 RepID=A0A3M7T0Y2_BRAPC|nr:hypothetical protein BpHYR1_003987 [Brachionus plicatilis]
MEQWVLSIPNKPKALRKCRFLIKPNFFDFLIFPLNENEDFYQFQFENLQLFWSFVGIRSRTKTDGQIRDIFLMFYPNLEQAEMI